MALPTDSASVKMKLYRRTTKRIAKKWLGSSWRKLQLAKMLKPGDLIHTCKGYNERIAEIEPRWSYDGRLLIDFDIISEVGSGHSLIHCCTLPLLTKEEIVAYCKTWITPEAVEWCEKQGYPFHRTPISLGILEGKEVFDDEGQPYYEYCSDHDKKARFPERWAAENPQVLALRKEGSDDLYGTATT